MKIQDLTLEHFNQSELEKDIRLEIWDDEVLLNTYFYKENHDISPFLEEIKGWLIHFDQDKELVLQNIIDEGYLQTAEEWAQESSSEISLPISEKDFLGSFYPFEIGFCIGNIDDEPKVMVYLGNTTDYFPDHVFCCYLNKKNNQMEYNSGLEG